MRIKKNLRNIVPRGIWQFAGFCKRLRSHWRLDRSESLRVQNRIAGLPLYVRPDLFVQIPESVTAYTNWRSHAIEDPTSSVETTDFLELAKGCSSLIDIGAQTGFMSALFARSRTSSCNVASLEPDPSVHAVLARARELNISDTINWTIIYEAVADSDASIRMPISNTLYEARNTGAKLGDLIDVKATTLASLVSSLTWQPDIIKIDVESFEYEILTSSMDLIARIKPALQLEVHWQILAERNLDALDFLKPLAKLGYAGIRSKYRTLLDWHRAAGKEGVSRLALHTA